MTFLDKDNGVYFNVILSPRASKTMLCGFQEDFLKIKVSSPPIDNKANKECVEFLSKIFASAKTGIKVVGGHKNRRKKIFIQGLDSKRAKRIIEEHLV